MSATLHPIELVDCPPPPRLEPGRAPVLAWLPLSKLRIDRSYQREITKKGRANVVRIVNTFSWSRFAPVLVTPIERGLYSVLDGQHRAAAALRCGFKEVPCAIVEAAASEQAQIFADVNGVVTKITTFDLFKAGRAAGLEWAKAIDRVCAGAGLVALTYPKAMREIKPFETMALGTLQKYIIRFGEQDCIAALKQLSKMPAAREPGFWNSRAIDAAIANYREDQGLRQAAAGSVDQLSIEQRIRDLKAKGHSRFAIQAALKVSLATIEAALSSDGK